MALQGTGHLLVRIGGPDLAPDLAAKQPNLFVGFAIKPLFEPAPTHPLYRQPIAANRWLIAKPVVPGSERTPWDSAHEAAKANHYAHYVEPDLVHERVLPRSLVGVAAPQPETKGLNTDYSPCGDAAKTVAPDWHLSSDYTGFSDVRNIATGKGVWIAHLDTGYTPGHVSKPKFLHSELGYDYWQDKPDAVDPGTVFLGCMPGHGTATLALLAGNTVSITFNNKTYDGYIGGAPEANIIPVRIAPTVIHLWTSTMAQGLFHALAQQPGPQTHGTQRCDVVSISHGGMPSSTWADAVNACYLAGIVIVAASSDNFHEILFDVPTHFTVYPSAFNRVLTAVGATFDKKPYRTNKFNVMQGSWGPDAVMKKALAGFTPNVPWMRYKPADLPDGWDMDGGGTSASTPQVAAACALWLELYRDRLTTDWKRVEACRLALFKSASHRGEDMSELGWGLLNVKAALDKDLADAVISEVNAPQTKPSGEDIVSHPLWRFLTGQPPLNSAQEQMYETEVAQILAQTDNPKLRRLVATALQERPLLHSERVSVKAEMLKEDISGALRQKIAALP